MRQQRYQAYCELLRIRKCDQLGKYSDLAEFYADPDPSETQPVRERKDEQIE